MIKKGIYGIFCLVNNGVYIGKTVDLKGFNRRWSIEKYYLRHNNRKQINAHLLNAWNKYGEENFEFKIIEECNSKIINQKEVQWIKYYRDNKYNVYNFTDGGDGSVGLKMSEEHKRKISEAMNGRKLSEEHKQNLSKTLKGKYCGKNAIWFGRHHSKETIQKLKKAKKGHNHPMFGKHHSEESKRKISIAKLGKPLSEETKSKMRGRKHSKETILKMKKRTCSEESKQYLRKINLGKHHSEETKRKISEKAKIRWALKTAA
jgi:group I intron endonuclease